MIDARWHRLAAVVVLPLLLVAAMSAASGRAERVLSCEWSVGPCASDLTDSDRVAHGRACGAAAACGVHLHAHAESLAAAIHLGPTLSAPTSRGTAEVPSGPCWDLLLAAGLFHPPRSFC